MPDTIVGFHRFLNDARHAAAVPEIRGLLRKHLLDLVGVMAAGLQTSLGRITGDFAAQNHGAVGAPARLPFDARNVSAPGAALAAGSLIDAFDAHDGNRLVKGHVGCATFAALFAAGQLRAGLDDRAALDALLVGYELGTRFGLARHRISPEYRCSGSWVAAASAAVSGRILGIGEAAMLNAIGIAEYLAPQGRAMHSVEYPSMVRDGSGWAAMTGVTAALLAQAGHTGPPAESLHSDMVTDIWEDLGSRWMVREQYLKPHPVCRWAQPPVEAILKLRQENPTLDCGVAEVEVRTFAAATGLHTIHPRNTDEAQFSLPYAVASAWVRGCVDVRDTALVDSAVGAIAERVRIIPDARLDELFPAQRLAAVTVILEDGARLRSGDTAARGDPERPLSEAEVQEKFRALAIPRLGRTHAMDLEMAVSRVDDAGGWQRLVELLVRRPDPVGAPPG